MTEPVDAPLGRASRPRVTRAVADASRSYVAEFYRFYPHRGTWAGWHENDGQVVDASRDAQAKRESALDAWGVRLRELERLVDARRVAKTISATTHATERLELATLEYARTSELFRFRRWRLYQTDPRAYYIALDASVFVTRLFAPPRERLHALTEYLRGIPHLLAAANDQIERSLSRRILDTALVTYRRLGAYYRVELASAGMTLAGTDREREGFDRALHLVLAALETFIQELEERLPEAHDNFRLGAGFVEEYLSATELLTFTLDELRALGQAALQRHQDLAEEYIGQSGGRLAREFARLDSNPLWPFGVLETASGTIDELCALFANGTLIAPLPPECTCSAQVMPPHLPAGTALFEGPGVFDTERMPAVLYLSLPPLGMTPRRRRIHMSRLSPWALRNTIAHEVMPGHYLHWAHMSRVESLAARAFPSLANIEGWAHYAEELALTCDHQTDPRYPLAHLRMGLLRNCRFLMALELHAGNASEQDAAEFIARHTGFSPGRAAEEALRGVLDPGYLVYSLGKALLLRLREEYATQQGTRYTPRRFHDAFFAQGGIPLPLVRQALLTTTKP